MNKPFRLLALILASPLLALWAGCASSDGPTSTGTNSGYTLPALGIGNSTGINDDPSIIKALDGYYYLVFLSDRSGNKDLWVTRSQDGSSWSTPVSVTNNPDEDLYPTLLQTSNGTFHLCWQRYNNSTFVSHIFYMNSTNGLDWSSSTETALTTGTVGDHAPMMVQAAGTTFNIYFSSADRSAGGKCCYNHDILMLTSPDQGSSWGSPLLLTSVSSDTDSDRMPYVVRNNTGYQMVFQRQATDDIYSNTSDLFMSTSADGVSWTAPTTVTSQTSDDVVDDIPSFIHNATATGNWFLCWTTSIATQGNGEGSLVFLPSGGTYPSNVVNFASEINGGGWSARSAGSLMIFVSKRSGKPQIYGMNNPL